VNSIARLKDALSDRGVEVGVNELIDACRDADVEVVDYVDRGAQRRGPVRGEILY
jgi:pyrimidine operon attenuation protein/uracil phosphoribosyltransferase